MFFGVEDLKIRPAIILILLAFILSAFSIFPVPLFALPLYEGRTLDEGHDLGLFDWHGDVSYVNLTHRDGVCPEDCSEQVTRIQDGSSVSGSFAAGNVNYFEAMVAFERRAGTAVLQACSSRISWDMHGSGVPGFISMPLYVPAGCTEFSLSASGGFVDFRSMDVGYGSPVTPPPTNTWTVGPPPTYTSTLTPVDTDTPVPTSVTLTAQTDTTTPTDENSPTTTLTTIIENTSTSTPSRTTTVSTSPTITPSGFVPSKTPASTTIPLTSTPRPPSGGGENHSNNPANLAVNNSPVYTSTVIIPISGGIIPTQNVVQVKTITPVSSSFISATPIPYSNVSLGSTPNCPMPSAPPVSTAGGGSFAAILAAAGLSIAAVLGLIQSFLKKPGSTVTSSSSGFTIKVPRTVEKKVTLWEWVTKPIRVLVQIARIVWRTIVEAIPRFINVTRRIVDYIRHSEWVTTYIRVAKTVYQWVLDRVPLLGFLGRIISWIWKYILKPVIQWVTQAVRTLRTWVETVVRWVVQRIQDGWNYITRTIQETIHEWVEQTQWVKELVSRQITVKEVVWDTQFVPFSSLVNSDGIKRVIQVGIAAGLISLAASQCNPVIPKPTPTPNYQATQVACFVKTQISQNTIIADIVNKTITAAYKATLTARPTNTLTYTVTPSKTPLSGVDYWKNLMNEEYGLSITDGNSKWTESNLETATKALAMIDSKLNGNLKNIINGTSLVMTDGGKQYYGLTDSSSVTFHVADSNTKIPLINFLHEIAHLIDLVPSSKNIFSKSLPASPAWVKDGYVNSELLLGKFDEQVQSKPLNESYDPYEYWADAFANYAADNININDKSGLGKNMAQDVLDAINKYNNP